MESSVVEKAHRSSRLKSATWAEAVAQNEKAADEYAKAAEDAPEGEAKRMLLLLEEHHRHLAKHTKSFAEGADHHVTINEAAELNPSDTTDNSNDLPAYAPSQDPKPISATTSTRKTKDWHLNSTIASNLASARGIPSHQTRSGSPATTRNAADPPRPAPPRAITDTIVPITNMQRTANDRDISSGASLSDAAFNKFYDTFGGLVSRLSAPLAFAGLPLVPKDAPLQSEPLQSVKSVSAEEINAQTHFSKAAIRALQDGGGGFAASHESFYVVPGASGNPYNKMLSSEMRDEEGQDIFVDAPGSPTVSRRAIGSRGSATNKTVEELETENAQLKSLTDKISRRLYDWEKMAQKQGAVLQQSIKMSGSSVMLPPRTPVGAVMDDAKVSELEQQIKTLQKEAERSTRERDKLQTVVARYRERWDKLKDSARTRRDTPEPPAV